MINKLFLDLSLYEPFRITEENGDDILSVVLYEVSNQFDAYCIECKKESTFKFFERNHGKTSKYAGMVPSTSGNSIQKYSYKTPTLVAYECQRNSEHKFTCVFNLSKDSLVKIGQYPSIATVGLSEIQKYRKPLSKYYNEFSRAVGLYSHGVGVGSFVYLRRIFENLIEDKRQIAAKDNNLDEEAFQSARMDEKIQILQRFLPKFLVENRKLYSILSKGIHDLSEQECLEMFPNIKIAIELILDEKIYQIEQEKKIKSARDFISNTMEKIKL